MFGRKPKRDVITINYEGQLPDAVEEFLNTTEEHPEILERQPLTLSVEKDRDFVDRLMSVVRKSQFKVYDIELRKQA